MQIFIDESGAFTGFHEGSISVVGALVIPDAKLDFLEKKFTKMRARLPLDKGEVKGRLLNEEQIDEVATLLGRNEVIFEVTAIDLGLQSDEEVKAYKMKHGEDMLSRVDNFAEAVRAEVRAASQEILDTSVPLYLQALTTFEVIHRLIGHMTMFYSQRRPQELGAIKWIVDGKDPKKITKWENGGRIMRKGRCQRCQDVGQPHTWIVATILTTKKAMAQKETMERTVLI